MTGADERPRGILTPKDRALLQGEIEYDHQQQYSNRYQDIRERIANGLLDFNRIQYLVRDRDRKRIFRDPSTEADVENPLFTESIRGMLYWTYLGLKEQNYNFEGLLSEAIEQAEEDFARNYRGESIDVAVRLDIDVTRSDSIDDIISAVEHGGPVPANRLYDLLELTGGVPIDTSELDTVRVWFRSSYPEGEKAVLETLFSEYLNAEVEVVDALARVSLTNEDIKDQKDSAAVDSDKQRPNPGEIKHHHSSMDLDLEGTSEGKQEEKWLFHEPERLENDREDGISLDEALDKTIDKSDRSQETIHELVEEGKMIDVQSGGMSPESILDLLSRIKEPFVSTEEIAAALNCAPEAASQPLSELAAKDQVERRSVMDTGGSRLDIWWLVSEGRD